MRDAWDRWGWAVALAACALFTARMLWGREPFCGSDTEQCFREWVSATGGWAAVAAAIPTIYFLNKQSRIANKGNQNNARLMLRKIQSIARRARYEAELAVSTQNICVNALTTNKSQGITFNDARNLMVSLISSVEKALANDVFERFEEEVDVPSWGIRDTRKMIRGYRNQIAETMHATNEAAIANEQRFLTACGVAENYCKSLIAMTNDFIVEAKAMMDEI